MNIVVLAEQQDYGIAGEDDGNANDNTTVTSQVTVANKKLNAAGEPSFELRVSRLRMPEFDSNDDGNGRNRVNYVFVDPVSTNEISTFSQSGSEGVLNFVVFNQRTSLSDQPR